MKRLIRKIICRTKYQKLNINDNGKNNKVLVFENEKSVPLSRLYGYNIKIEFMDSNDATVKINLPIRVDNLLHIRIRKSNNAVFELGKNAHCVSCYMPIYNSKDGVLKIGDNLFAGGTEISVNEGAKVYIGSGCMFSYEVLIRTGDGHAIFNKDTKKILNLPTEDFIIGDHVWLGQKVTVYKNARLPSNTIVGVGSIVTKPFVEEYTAIAGIPAKVVRRNVGWDFMNAIEWVQKNPV
jgi:acetyltransferase-like isoleucine patch superfamily enzyme